MIESRIVLRGETYNQTHDRIRWCNKNIGNCAIARDCVGESTPWFAEFQVSETVWHFANEVDVSMFALRWAGNEGTA